MTASKNLADEVANVYERAINGPMSHNALLYFAYADYEEGRIKYDKAHLIYTKFLEQHDIDPSLVFIKRTCATFQKLSVTTIKNF